MEYIFQTQSLEVEPLVPQVSRALEKRVEMISRREYPEMWAKTDKANEKRAGRPDMKRLRGSRLMSLSCVALGVFLFVPCLSDPGRFWLPLIVSAFSIVWGCLRLWMSTRPAKAPFEKAARKLLKGLSRLPEGQSLRVCLDEAGMDLAGEAKVPVEAYEFAIETEDLFLITFGGNVALLQKENLVQGDLEDFRTFISEQTAYIKAMA